MIAKYHPNHIVSRPLSLRYLPDSLPNFCHRKILWRAPNSPLDSVRQITITAGEMACNMGSAGRTPGPGWSTPSRGFHPNGNLIFYGWIYKEQWTNDLLLTSKARRGWEWWQWLKKVINFSFRGIKQDDTISYRSGCSVSDATAQALEKRFWKVVC